MGREVRRVPKGFDWPLKEVWQGYIQPDWLDEENCPDCTNGYSPFAQHIYDQWYGNAQFDPSEVESKPLTADEPAVWAFAKRNVERAPEYYGEATDTTIEREARRLLGYWNKQLSHHLQQDDIDALIRAGRKPEGTTAGQWREQAILEPMFTSSSDSWTIIKHRCEKAGEPEVCATCDGHATVEKWKGQRAAAEKWEWMQPPEGEAWQMWETTSEGSPISPAMDTPEELADWLVANSASVFGDSTATREEWLSIICGEMYMHQIAPGVVAI